MLLNVYVNACVCTCGILCWLACFQQLVLWVFNVWGNNSPQLGIRAQSLGFVCHQHSGPSLELSCLVFEMEPSSQHLKVVNVSAS